MISKREKFQTQNNNSLYACISFSRAVAHSQERKSGREGELYDVLLCGGLGPATRATVSTVRRWVRGKYHL